MKTPLVKAHTSTIRSQVLEVIKASGYRGCISDEVRQHLPQYCYSSITQRYHELIMKDLMYRDGHRRGNTGANQSVMYATNLLVVNKEGELVKVKTRDGVQDGLQTKEST
jgi:hypothetical protein